MNIIELHSEAEARAAIKELNNDPYIILDCETTGLDPFTDTLTLIILGSSNTTKIFTILPDLVATLADLTSPIVAHNFKFDFNFIYRAGVDLRNAGLHADTLHLDHLLDENLEHSLDAIVKRRYNANYKEVFWSRYKTFQEAPKEEGLNYACKDVDYTRRLYRDVTRDLRRNSIPDSLIEHCKELALNLYATELDGIALDLPYLAKIGEELSVKIHALRTSMRKEVSLAVETVENSKYLSILNSYKTDRGRANAKKPEFSFDSTQQLGDLLYEHLGLPVQLNKSRKQTVDDAALANVEDLHPIVPLVREYRGYQKLFTAFIQGSLEKQRSGRIYPKFNISGTVTGRISSSEPNMQQLPKEGGIRGIYIPDPGTKFITADYGQLEVSLAAHYSRDKNLLKVVFDGVSLHDITAEGLGTSRALAKTINFALQYGAGVQKIQRILGCTPKAAQEALDKYWDTYNGLFEFIKSCHQKLDRGEPLINLYGRRRLFPKEYKSHWDKERAKRQAPNSLIQGTGADITSRALYLVNKALLDRGIGKAIFSIHDEILIQANDTSCVEASELLRSIMVGVGQEIKLTVPLQVDCSKPMERWAK